MWLNLLVLAACVILALAIAATHPPSVHPDQVEHFEQCLAELELRVARLERANWTAIESTRRLDQVEERLSALEDANERQGTT